MNEYMHVKCPNCNNRVQVGFEHAFEAKAEAALEGVEG